MVHLMPRGREAAPLQDFFNSFFEGVAPSARKNGCAPTSVAALPIDIAESADAYTIHASLPGFDRDSIEIQLDEGVLSIKATSKTQTHESESQEGTTWLRRERRTSSLERRLAMPKKIEEAAITAELKDGVLTLTLPKAKEESAKVIKIS